MTEYQARAFAAVILHKYINGTPNTLDGPDGPDAAFDAMLDCIAEALVPLALGLASQRASRSVATTKEARQSYHDDCHLNWRDKPCYECAEVGWLDEHGNIKDC